MKYSRSYAISEQEQFLRATIDGLSANICVIDAVGTIIRTNRAWNIYGTENNADGKTNCEGYNYLDVCLTASETEKLDSEEFSTGIRAVIAGILPEFVKEYPCHSPAEQRWFLCRVNPLHVNGTHYAVISHEDITGRKLAEQNLRDNQQQLKELNSTLERKVQERTAELLQERDNLKRILDTMHNGVYIVNQQLKIKYANPALLQEFGPVMDRTCHEYLHGSQQICAWCNNREVFSGQTVYCEWMSKINGKTYSTFDTPYKNAEGEICKLAILHDITSQKIAEQTIKEHNEELEHQVKERTRALENANFELTVINEELEQGRIELDTALFAAKQATRVKSEFLSIMSHEIRTPLSAIIGFTDLTLEASLLPHQADYICKIQSAGETLLNIVNDILDFSKIEAGQVKMELIPFRLDTTFANASSIVEKIALDKELNLIAMAIPEAAMCLVGDPHRLGQVIVNLLSNAVKFTERGEVQLQTELLARHSDRMQLKFTVSDTGIGISAEHIDTLFLPFSQAETSTTRRFGGTGLGLSISRQLVDLMGGEIWCESELGQGSRFCFTAWFGACQESDIDQCISVCATDLKGLWPPSEEAVASIHGDMELVDITLIFNTLQDYIKGSDGKAERYLDDYQRELSGLADNDIRQIKKYLRNFDFVAAHDALLSISARLGIILASDEAEECQL
jgi:signal transduction histidine kinase